MNPRSIPYEVKTPILLIVFRRADLVTLVLEELRSVRPCKLYVAADGPRPGVATEPAECEAVRRAVVEGIDWPCEVRLRFRDANLGVQDGVVDAINWVFSTEEQAIILEDDILPTVDFFRFCDELLDRYRADSQVAAICGTSYLQGPSKVSYYASNCIDMWGWATWRDRWRGYDAQMSAWPSFDHSGRLAAMPGASPRFARYWRNIFDRTLAGHMNTWDYQWILTCWNKGQVALHPKVPLVRNIGFDDRASHTQVNRQPRYSRVPRPLSFPLHAPSTLKPDAASERAMWAFRFYISAWDDFLVPIKAKLGLLRRLIKMRLGK